MLSLVMLPPPPSSLHPRAGAVAAYAARLLSNPFPWAHAHGYVLSPLRGCLVPRADAREMIIQIKFSPPSSAWTWHQGTLWKTWNYLRNFPIPSQSENPVPRQRRDFRESGKTAVDPGRLRKPFLQVFLIKRRSRASTSPRVRAWRDLGKPRSATKAASPWERRRKPGVVWALHCPSRVGGDSRAGSQDHTAPPKPRLPESTLFHPSNDPPRRGRWQSSLVFRCFSPPGRFRSTLRWAGRSLRRWSWRS